VQAVVALGSLENGTRFNEVAGSPMVIRLPQAAVENRAAIMGTRIFFMWVIKWFARSKD
jgi:hypothetical protein